MKKNHLAMLTLVALVSVMVGCSKVDKDMSTNTKSSADTFEFNADKAIQAGKQENPPAESAKAAAPETPKKSAKSPTEFEYKPNPKLFPHLEKNGNK